MSNKIRYNKSKTYLLPLLSEIVGFDKKFFNSLLNTYMFDDLGKYKNCFYILHKFTFKNPEYTKYENTLISNELFVDLIDMDDKVLYIFKFPKEYIKEYNLMKVGKYSLFGKDAKELILEFFTHVYKGNLNAVKFLIKVKQILFKNERLKKEIEDELKVKLPDNAELTDIIKRKNETFNLSQYINKNEDINKEIK